MAATDAVNELYRALNARDPERVLAALSDGFTGRVSAGMPLGVGGTHDGPEAMLMNVWARVFTAFDIHLDVERVLTAEDGSVVAVGDYRGTERGTGREFAARFVHLLAVDGDRVSALEQITDTHRWISD